MQTLSLFLVIANFLAGTLSSVQAQLLTTFNVFDTSYGLPELVQNLNVLIGPLRNQTEPDLELGAKSAFILDHDSGKVLFDKNSDTRLPMASITKIMTAVLVLDHYGNNLDLPVDVSADAVKATGSRMRLQTNENITIRNLLKGLLIESANDAGIQLAITVAGSPEAFVALMNQRAKQLELKNTHFTNPVGYDNAEHYSTAQDLAVLARHAIDHPVFAEIVKTDKIEIKDTTGKIVHSLSNTNQLIGQYANVTGIKTGTTDEAGQSLVASATGTSGQQVIVVLLNSPSRFQEGKKALDWALKAYSWIELA